MPPGHRHALTLAVLGAEQRALEHGRGEAFAATWVKESRARRRAVQIATDVQAMGVSVIWFRVTAVAAPTPRSRPATWRSGVRVKWTTSQMGGRAAVSSLTYTFQKVGTRAAVTDVRTAPGAREPVWLTGRLRVARRPANLMAVAANLPAARELAHRLEVARRDVRRFLPGEQRGLTAYLPRDVGDFESILGTAPEEDSDVAAVTTTVDGSSRPRAPVAIVLNPQVWPRLRPAGAHVVVTHEAVHALTGSVTADLPEWVSEGFADYVAVTAAHVPSTVATAQAVRRIRHSGLPRRLPADADFRSTGHRLEATYELSRLAVATIARYRGRSALAVFYRDMVAHPVLAEALRPLRATPGELTRWWRRLLVGLARAH